MLFSGISTFSFKNTSCNFRKSYLSQKTHADENKRRLYSAIRAHIQRVLFWLNTVKGCNSGILRKDIDSSFCKVLFQSLFWNVYSSAILLCSETFTVMCSWGEAQRFKTENLFQISARTFLERTVQNCSLVLRQPSERASWKIWNDLLLNINWIVTT